MSKVLGKAAADAIAKDVYGGSPDLRFKLARPPSFAFLNSLKLLDIDQFAGVTVARIESILWTVGTDVTSTFTDANGTHYSGSSPDSPPPGAAIHSRKKWVIVLAYQLATHLAGINQVLTNRGCQPSTENTEPFFIFLRANSLLTFNSSMSMEASQRIAFQPESPDYTATSHDDLLPFYETFVAYEVDPNSPLVDRSVFWFSYLVATKWHSGQSRYVSAQALAYLDAVYDKDLRFFPIDNARVALVAAHFKHTYIDLYRCIEWLYAMPRSMMVKVELNLAQKATVLAKAFRDKLTWRRNEIDSLRLLLQAAGPERLDLSILQQCLLDPLPPLPTGAGAEMQIWRNEVVDKLAPRIYGVRNQFVHQFDADDLQKVETNAEGPFITLLAQLCAILYEKYELEF